MGIIEYIPFNRPCFSGSELNNISDAIKSGWISGDGGFTKKCQTYLEEKMGAPKALLTTSCTDALEMSSILLNIKEGDEVIVPSFTFVSTINAFALRGAKPVFIDSRPDTLNMNEELLESLITPKTKAIVPVHYAGVGCEMDKIMELANKHEVTVVEDNAHGLFGKYKGQQLGTIAPLATQSFHETKNIICGEGGALIINDEKYRSRSEIIREKGTNRAQFFRGEVDKYGWVDIGSSFLPSDIVAAFLYSQLQNSDQIQIKRQNIWNTYNTQLKTWATENNVLLPTIPEHCDQAYHMFYMIMPNLENRTRFIETMLDRQIKCVFHYLPLNSSLKGQEFGGKVGDCPVTEDISERLVRIPFFNDITPEQQERVIEEILRFKCS